MRNPNVYYRNLLTATTNPNSMGKSNSKSLSHKLTTRELIGVGLIVILALAACSSSSSSGGNDPPETDTPMDTPTGIPTGIPTQVTAFTALQTRITENANDTPGTTVTLKLNVALPADAEALSFPYTIANIDISDIAAPGSLTGAITVAAGSMTGTLTIRAADDMVNESAGEVLTISLGALPNGITAPNINPVEITIIDNDGSSGISPEDQQLIDDFNFNIDEGSVVSISQPVNLVTSLADENISISYTSSDPAMLLVRDRASPVDSSTKEATPRCTRSVMESALVTLTATFRRGVTVLLGEKMFMLTVECAYCIGDPPGPSEIEWTVANVSNASDDMAPLRVVLGDALIFVCPMGTYSNVWITESEAEYLACNSPTAQSVGECVGFVDSRDLQLSIRQNTNTPESAIRLAVNQEYYLASFSDGEVDDQFSERKSGGECVDGLKIRMQICLPE